jgi:hypothetical protein
MMNAMNRLKSQMKTSFTYFKDNLPRAPRGIVGHPPKVDTSAIGGV